MACHVCERSDVRKMPRSGKKHFPHKCPHGVWCVTGDRLLGHHANNVPVAGKNHCAECAAVHRKRRLERV
jgi:hypothetical protein